MSTAPAWTEAARAAAPGTNLAVVSARGFGGTRHLEVMTQREWNARDTARGLAGRVNGSQFAQVTAGDGADAAIAREIASYVRQGGIR